VCRSRRASRKKKLDNLIFGDQLQIAADLDGPVRGEHGQISKELESAFRGARWWWNVIKVLWGQRVGNSQLWRAATKDFVVEAHGRGWWTAKYRKLVVSSGDYVRQFFLEAIAALEAGGAAAGNDTLRAFALAGGATIAGKVLRGIQGGGGLQGGPTVIWRGPLKDLAWARREKEKTLLHQQKT